MRATMRTKQIPKGARKTTLNLTRWNPETRRSDYFLLQLFEGQLPVAGIGLKAWREHHRIIILIILCLL
jgi:hypothetical protein